MARDADTDVLAALHARHFGEVPAAVTPLKGDASDRRIFRLVSAGATSIGILGPNIPENRAFTGFARAFRAAGLAVPEIFAIADGHGAYLEEDLGDVTLALWQEGLVPERRADLLVMYERVLNELVRFQVDAVDAVDYGLCYQSGEFGEEAMLFDVTYFRTHVLERLARVEWDSGSFDCETRALVALLQRAPRDAFLYRDFQSRNIMIRDGAPWFIDFQSGRRGAVHYDVAALLYDSRSRLGDSERMALVARYCDALAERRPVDRDEFLFFFHGFAVLRLLQALGAFANIGLNKGKPAFLDLIPSRLAALGELLRAAEIMRPLAGLRGLLLDLAADPDKLAIPRRQD